MMTSDSGKGGKQGGKKTEGKKDSKDGNKLKKEGEKRKEVVDMNPLYKQVARPQD